jgi:hypothetical protein
MGEGSSSGEADGVWGVGSIRNEDVPEDASDGVAGDDDCGGTRNGAVAGAEDDGIGSGALAGIDDEGVGSTAGSDEEGNVPGAGVGGNVMGEPVTGFSITRPD